MNPRRQELWRNLIEATLTSISIRGYTATTVTHITDLAEVNRTQFYFVFHDKDECFLAVQDAVFGEIEECIRECDYEGLDWADQMRVGLDSVLELFDLEPVLARVVLQESSIAGPEAQVRQVEARDRLLPLIDAGRELVPANRSLPAAISEMALGSAMALLDKALRSDGKQNFSDLAPQILFAILMPFIGPPEAMERARLAYPEATTTVAG